MCKLAFIAGLALLVLPPLWFVRRRENVNTSPDTEQWPFFFVAGAVALALVLMFASTVAMWLGWCS